MKVTEWKHQIPPKLRVLSSKKSALQDRLQNLDASLHSLTTTQTELIQFQDGNPSSHLDAEIMALKEQARRDAERRVEEVQRVKDKHEASVAAAKRRADGIVMGVETVASQVGFAVLV